MDLRTAITSYQFGERAKSELIICSQLAMALSGFPETEREGGKRMLVMMMEIVRSETEFAEKATGRGEFRKAVGLTNEAISNVESMNLGNASLKLGEAISAVTTAAQEAWIVLEKHELL
jgi:hypothetical protein